MLLLFQSYVNNDTNMAHTWHILRTRDQLYPATLLLMTWWHKVPGHQQPWYMCIGLVVPEYIQASVPERWCIILVTDLQDSVSIERRSRYRNCIKPLIWYTRFCFALYCFVYITILVIYILYIHILQGYFPGTGAIVWLPQSQWSNPEGYG